VVLDTAVKALNENPEITSVILEGHADSDGSDKYNEALGKRRAQYVYDYLVKHGVDSNRLITISFGESSPVEPNTTKEGKDRNRRTEFVFGKKQ
jgi:OOP family OmpA-OmpF porin